MFVGCIWQYSTPIVYIESYMYYTFFFFLNENKINHRWLLFIIQRPFSHWLKALSCCATKYNAFYHLNCHMCTPFIVTLWRCVWLSLLVPSVSMFPLTFVLLFKWIHHICGIVELNNNAKQNERSGDRKKERGQRERERDSSKKHKKWKQFEKKNENYSMKQWWVEYSFNLYITLFTWYVPCTNHPIVTLKVVVKKR